MTAGTVSVVGTRIDVEEEPTMIATTAYIRPGARRAHGFDYLAMRVSLAVLLWARRRADRHAVSRDELSRRFRIQRETERREHAFASRLPRG
jgi:hypothetical protein